MLRSFVTPSLLPISLTCTIAKIMEGFTCTRLLSQLKDKLDLHQYARKKHSTSHALAYTLQAIYVAVDSDEAGVCLFFADFSKGFTLYLRTGLQPF